MYKIWFERDALSEYVPMFDAVAEGIGPGDRVEQDRYHQLELAHAVVAGGNFYDAAAMKRAPNLLVISRTGIGFDRVDLDAATAHRIAVCNAPDAPTVPTAETALALMMSVARSLKSIENTMQRSIDSGAPTNFWNVYVGIELSGKQLGLVGLGRIGGHVARVATALGMQVAAYDPYISDERFSDLGVQRADALDGLLGAADVVSAHVPLNPETQKFMNAERFAQMKRGAIFVNVSRGALVDEAALADALDSGHLFGAGLDVTDPEPPLAGNRLLNRDNVVITPHIGGASVLGRRRLFVDAIEQILQVLRGERPPNLLNPDVWDAVLARWQAGR